MVGASVPECAQLSIYKKPKQRKSIFDVDTFKRPEAPPKLDYLSLSQMPKHSPQNSKSEAGETPPTPPARSDSFRFKHHQQNSSASDSTITTDSAQASDTQDAGEGGGQRYYMEAPPGEAKAAPRKPSEEEGSRQRTEEQDRKRYRPKSAPALRRNMTPLHIPIPMQVTEKHWFKDSLSEIFYHLK